MSQRWRPNYSQAEVRALVDGYAELREVRDTSRGGLRLLLALVDLDRAYRHLEGKLAKTILLHGLLDLQGAETLLGVDRVTLWRWHKQGIAEMTDFLNGEKEGV